MQRISRFFIALPTLIGSLLSCAMCPMCIPIYASIFTALGVDAVQASPYLLGIMFASMIATLTLIYSQIQQKNLNWTPFILALASAIGIVITKFLGFNTLMYLSLAVFFGAALWNRRKAHHH